MTTDAATTANPKKGYYPVSVVAAMCDIDVRRVQQLAKEGVIPKARRGEYHLVDCVRGYVRFLRDRSEPSEGRPASLDAARKRKLAAEAELAELELAKAREQVVPVEQFRSALLGAFGRVRSKAREAPSRLTPQLVGKGKAAAIRPILDRFFAELLAELRHQDVPDEEPDEAVA